MNAPAIPGRRRLVRAAAVPLAGRIGLAAVANVGATAATPARAVTPACVDPAEPPPPQTAGPVFTPDSPGRQSLVEPDMPGTRLTLSGLVLATDCRPVPHALLDFWQADSEGRYDNEGYRLRGHLHADDQGRWRLQTILPGIYPGRTRNIHVRVRAEGGPLLTTQLYFPGEVRNRRDRLFSPALLVAVTGPDTAPAAAGSAASSMAATIDFVLAG